MMGVEAMEASSGLGNGGSLKSKRHCVVPSAGLTPSIASAPWYTTHGLPSIVPATGEDQKAWTLVGGMCSLRHRSAPVLLSSPNSVPSLRLHATMTTLPITSGDTAWP